MPHSIILHPADNGGCSHYRMRFPAWAMQTMVPDVHITDSCKLITDQMFYANTKMVRIQRQIADFQAQFILNFLRPVTDKIGSWLVYEIDDVIGMDDIPKYNMGWDAYQNPQLMKNVEQIVNVCDFLTVTCEELGNYFVRKFNVNPAKVLVVPNYLPRWWMANYFNADYVSAKYDHQKAKPRVGFICSTTHFDVHNRTNGIDDFTHIIDFIKKNIDKYEFISVGGYPRQLQAEVDAGKFKVIPGFDILNYPYLISQLHFNLIIAPLQDNIFNRCKSNIKFLETSALGIPCFCQNLPTYSKYTNMLFNDSRDLEVKVANFLANKQLYMETVIKNRQFVDNPHNSWWLENNINKWMDLYTNIPQRTLRFSMIDESNSPNNMPVSLPPSTVEGNSGLVIDLSKEMV